MTKHTQILRAEHEAAKQQTSYFEQVVAHVAELAECGGGDAQGIIGAYALTQYGHRQNGILDATEWVMDDAEDAGTTPENLARTILNLQTI
jgi:hypothetical protein